MPIKAPKLNAKKRPRVALLDAPEVELNLVPVEPNPLPVEVPQIGNGRLHIPNSYTRTQVEMMCAFGLTTEQVAYVVGITTQTLNKHYPDEIKHGLMKANVQITQRLWDIAMRGTGPEAFQAIRFWLRTRGSHGVGTWVEKTLVGGTINHLHDHEHAHHIGPLSHEERAARVAQLLAAGSTGGAGSALVEHVRALVASARPADPGIQQSG